jgi:hypothetical protein
MSTRNITVVRRVVEGIWNHRDLDLADSLFAATYINHGRVIPEFVVGPEAIKVSVALYHTAFPHLVITIDRLHVDGDIVDLGWTAHAPLRDGTLPPGWSEEGGTLAGSTRSRLIDGRIVESWTRWDRRRALRRVVAARAMERRGASSTFFDQRDG